MKEFVTAIAVVGMLPQLNGQALFTYDFAGADPAGDALVPSVEHLTLSPFTRVNVGAVSQSDMFSSSHWNTGVGCDFSEYVSFTIKPETGYSLRIESLQYDISRSTSGPQSGRVSLLKDGSVIESSVDYTIDTTMAGRTFDFSDVTVRDWETLEFRFYGWNAASTGNLRLDNVSGFGQVTAVPEPSAFAGTTTGGLLALAIHRRIRRSRR